MKRLLTLLPMAFDGVGPSYTCMKLLESMAQEGLGGPVFVDRSRAQSTSLDLRSTLPDAFARLPYRWVSPRVSRLTERRGLKALSEECIAYLWPAASLSVYDHVRRAGLPVLAEGINTRMGYARELLDGLYDAEGLAPAHGITQARIDEEDEKLAMTSAIFAPSSLVEDALNAAPHTPPILQSSYGVDLARASADPSRPALRNDRVTVLFVGYACIRKGFHKLLQAWQMAGFSGRLIVVGRIEAAIRAKYADILDRPDIELRGFLRDTDPVYREADIFVLPSFEEGDPLVTYEAASHGLPLVTSVPGGGRLAEETECALLIDPDQPASIAAALNALAEAPDLRREYARQSIEAVRDFSWEAVGRRRAAQILEHFG